MNASLAAEAVPEIDRKAKVPAPLRSTQLHSRDTGGSNPPRSAKQSLSLGILRSNRQIARASGLFRTSTVAEKITFPQMTRDSRPKSLLANLARPFGPGAERNWDGRESGLSGRSAAFRLSRPAAIWPNNRRLGGRRFASFRSSESGHKHAAGRCTSRLGGSRCSCVRLVDARADTLRSGSRA